MSLKLDNIHDFLALRYNSELNKEELSLKIFSKLFNDYQDLQIQSASLDRLLGFNINAIEDDIKKLARKNNPNGTIESWSLELHDACTWVGLSPAQLQTPYFEFIEIIQKLSQFNYKSFLDIGAGYGRLGILLGLFYPHLTFQGIELVAQRVNEGNRVFSQLGFENAKLLCANVNDYLPQADLYFIYDFGLKEDMLKLIDQLSDKANLKESFGVIARGSAINKLILEKAPWLLKSDIELYASSFYYFD